MQVGTTGYIYVGYHLNVILAYIRSMLFNALAFNMYLFQILN